MKTLPLLAAVLLSVPLCLFSQPAQWTDLVAAQSVNGGGHSTDIVCDAAGNMYITGYFTHTIHFGSDYLTSEGDSDIFVAKVDSDGDWDWAVRAGSTGTDQGNGIAVDAAGNIYVTGFFEGTVNFGSISRTSSGGKDSFIGKLNSSGVWAWVVRCGGTGRDEGADIAVQTSGSIWAVGIYTGPANIVGANLSAFGLEDLYVVKLDTNGSGLWVNRAGGPYSDKAGGVAVDEAGNAWFCGSFNTSAVFSRITGDISLTAAGLGDAFVAKITPSGMWDWAIRGGGWSHDWAYDVATDGNGSAWVSGSFTDTASFGSDSITAIGIWDAYVAKVSASGSWVWATGGGSIDEDEGYAIDVDAQGNSYLTGSYKATAHFGDIVLYASLATADTHFYVARLDSAGEFVWALRSTGPYSEITYGVSVVGEQDMVAVCGSFYGNILLTSSLAGVNESYRAPCVAVVGGGSPKPEAPQNLSVFMISGQPGLPAGYFVTLDWTHVLQDTYGCPVSIDHYDVWANRSGNPYGSYELEDQVPLNFMRRMYLTEAEVPQYFRVTAVIVVDYP